MTAKDLTIIALRLMSLLFLFSGIPYFVSAIGVTLSFNEYKDWTNMKMALLTILPHFIFYAAAVALLWFKATGIAERICYGFQQKTVNIQIAANELQTITFAAIAFIFLAGVVNPSRNLLYRSFGPNNMVFNGTWILDVLNVIIHLSLFLFLLFGAKGLARFLHRLRKA